MVAAPPRVLEGAGPLWQRWWFITLLVVLGAVSAWALLKCRATRVRQLRKVRTRIGRDLHDDIGSNLTRIAVLCEALREQSTAGDAATEARLTSIGRISRESIAAMSDIIWAINPQQECLTDLVRRMREHAEEVFAERGIALSFSAPDQGELQLRLDMDLRREVLLIFKEAITNTARHACCSRVAVSLRLDSEFLHLEVTDDGIGFEPSDAPGGNGVPSMRRRAARLSGRCGVRTAPGRGTSIQVRIPLKQSRAAATLLARIRRVQEFARLSRFEP